MATPLLAQLEKRRLHLGISTQLPSLHHKPSILFSSKDAANTDVEAIYCLAINGFEALKSEEPKFAVFTNTIMAQSKVRLNRGLLSSEANRGISENLEGFIALLAPFFLRKHGQVVFEFLIRIYCVHLFDIDTLLRYLLPYHDNILFVKLLECLKIPPSGPWHSLSSIPQSRHPIPRSELVKNISTNIGMLQVISDTSSKIVAFGIEYPLWWSFCTFTAFELSQKYGITEQRLRVMWPLILELGGNPDIGLNVFSVALNWLLSISHACSLSPVLLSSVFQVILSEQPDTDSRRQDLIWSVLVTITQKKVDNTILLTSKLCRLMIRSRSTLLPWLQRARNRSIHLDNFYSLFLSALVTLSNGENHSAEHFLLELISNDLLDHKTYVELAMLLLKNYEDIKRANSSSEPTHNDCKQKNLLNDQSNVSLSTKNEYGLLSVFKALCDKEALCISEAIKQLDSHKHWPVLLIGTPFEIISDSSNIYTLEQALINPSSHIRCSAYSSLLDLYLKDSDNTLVSLKLIDATRLAFATDDRKILKVTLKHSLAFSLSSLSILQQACKWILAMKSSKEDLLWIKKGTKFIIDIIIMDQNNSSNDPSLSMTSLREILHVFLLTAVFSKHIMVILKKYFAKYHLELNTIIKNVSSSFETNILAILNGDTHATNGSNFDTPDCLHKMISSDGSSRFVAQLLTVRSLNDSPEWPDHFESRNKTIHVWNSLREDFLMKPFDLDDFESIPPGIDSLYSTLSKLSWWEDLMLYERQQLSPFLWYPFADPRTVKPKIPAKHLFLCWRELLTASYHSRRSSSCGLENGVIIESASSDLIHLLKENPSFIKELSNPKISRPILDPIMRCLQYDQNRLLLAFQSVLRDALIASSQQVILIALTFLRAWITAFHHLSAEFDASQNQDPKYRLQTTDATKRSTASPSNLASADLSGRIYSQFNALFGSSNAIIIYLITLLSAPDPSIRRLTLSVCSELLELVQSISVELKELPSVWVAELQAFFSKIVSCGPMIAASAVAAPSIMKDALATSSASFRSFLGRLIHLITDTRDSSHIVVILAPWLNIHPDAVDWTFDLLRDLLSNPKTAVAETLVIDQRSAPGNPDDSYSDTNKLIRALVCQLCSFTSESHPQRFDILISALTSDIDVMAVASSSKGPTSDLARLMAAHIIPSLDPSRMTILLYVLTRSYPSCLESLASDYDISVGLLHLLIAITSAEGQINGFDSISLITDDLFLNNFLEYLHRLTTTELISPKVFISIINSDSQVWLRLLKMIINNDYILIIFIQWVALLVFHDLGPHASGSMNLFVSSIDHLMDNSVTPAVLSAIISSMIKIFQKHELPSWYHLPKIILRLSSHSALRETAPLLLEFGVRTPDYLLFSLTQHYEKRYPSIRLLYSEVLENVGSKLFAQWIFAVFDWEPSIFNDTSSLAECIMVNVCSKTISPLNNPLELSASIEATEKLDGVHFPSCWWDTFPSAQLSPSIIKVGFELLKSNSSTQHQILRWLNILNYGICLMDTSSLDTWSQLLSVLILLRLHDSLFSIGEISLLWESACNVALQNSTLDWFIPWITHERKRVRNIATDILEKAISIRTSYDSNSFRTLIPLIRSWLPFVVHKDFQTLSSLIQLTISSLLDSQRQSVSLNDLKSVDYHDQTENTPYNFEYFDSLQSITDSDAKKYMKPHDKAGQTHQYQFVQNSKLLETGKQTILNHFDKPRPPTRDLDATEDPWQLLSDVCSHIVKIIDSNVELSPSSFIISALAHALISNTPVNITWMNAFNSMITRYIEASHMHLTPIIIDVIQAQLLTSPEFIAQAHIQAWLQIFAWKPHSSYLNPKLKWELAKHILNSVNSRITLPSIASILSPSLSAYNIHLEDLNMKNKFKKSKLHMILTSGELVKFYHDHIALAIRYSLKKNPMKLLYLISVASRWEYQFLSDVKMSSNGLLPELHATSIRSLETEESSDLFQWISHINSEMIFGSTPQPLWHTIYMLKQLKLDSNIAPPYFQTAISICDFLVSNIGLTTLNEFPGDVNVIKHFIGWKTDDANIGVVPFNSNGISKEPKAATYFDSALITYFYMLHLSQALSTLPLHLKGSHLDPCFDVLIKSLSSTSDSTVWNKLFSVLSLQQWVVMSSTSFVELYMNRYVHLIMKLIRTIGSELLASCYKQGQSETCSDSEMMNNPIPHLILLNQMITLLELTLMTYNESTIDASDVSDALIQLIKLDTLPYLVDLRVKPAIKYVFKRINVNECRPIIISLRDIIQHRNEKHSVHARKSALILLKEFHDILGENALVFLPEIVPCYAAALQDPEEDIDVAVREIIAILRDQIGDDQLHRVFGVTQ